MELEANDLLKASESFKVRLLSVDRPSRSQYRFVEDGDDDEDVATNEEMYFVPNKKELEYAEFCRKMLNFVILS